ncbi:hypothetical protein DJ021_12770 [Phenylobacterium hankyongense]|uniref:Uncharacterized protein n=1 Tax=Phenylobacterium hankyongense TaxID=1813876 RepID=A0A328B1D5_9CAUL|nr:hypothetical protein [Phenylobacterium hankyongense]RAK60617.1 hypothetical protein DJ021_12770 [Phenylobacterium hankyongense]
MAEMSSRRTSPWMAFCAGAVVMLAIVLAWWALSAGRRAADRVTLIAPIPRPSDLRVPHLPSGPKLPNPPMPVPK